MKTHQPKHFKISKSKNHGLLVQVDEGKYFYNQLHYHPEFQITAILQGVGILYAGNNMSTFVDRDVFIIGANVPHLLKSSSVYYTDNSPGVKGVSLFFDKFSFGKQFFELKEMFYLQNFLNDANRGIKVTGELKELIYHKIISSTAIHEEQLIITFLEILSLFRRSEKAYINSEQYKLILNKNEGSRLNTVLDYTFRHFNKEITIEQISNIAFLSRSQFSYFFKLHTGKSYIQFLNDLRIENACILLQNEKFNIEQICYQVGYQNVSNFVRHFKKIKGVTPSGYRKSWMIL